MRLGPVLGGVLGVRSWPGASFSVQGEVGGGDKVVQDSLAGSQADHRQWAFRSMSELKVVKGKGQVASRGLNQWHRGAVSGRESCSSVWV